MSSIVKQALVNHSARQMFAIVADVEQYPNFLPWCAKGQVISQETDKMMAQLSVDFKGIKQTFITENHFKNGEFLHMDLKEGPFRYLHGKWRFEELTADACKVYFSLDFEFNSFMLQKIATPIFMQIANTMLDAFIKRSREIYD